ncbi:MAG TPA: hypothetical protein VGN37_28090 [Actinocatenispora sp.]
MGETVVTRSTGERIAVGVGFPLLGAAVLVGLSRAADWLAGLPWAPLQGPSRLVARIPEPYATVGANALLRARALAVRKDDRDDADDLRAELGRLGVVVRDTDKRQYWRRVG